MFSTYLYLYEAAFAVHNIDYNIIIFEIIFLIDLIKTFMTEYTPKDVAGTGKESKPVRNLS